MTAPRPEPWISQTDQRRVAVEGRLPGGEPCTLLFVQTPDLSGWNCYRFGVTKDVIALTDADVHKIARVLGGLP